jgi:hypothetical protein
MQKAGAALVAEQRADGGWSQLRSLTSDAYATGQALVALAESGILATRTRPVDLRCRHQLGDDGARARLRQAILNACSGRCDDSG